MAVENDDNSSKKNYIVEVDAHVSEDVKRELESLPEDMEKIEAILAEQDLDGPKEQVKVHYVLGKPYGMQNGLAASVFLVRDNDTRYPEFAAAKTLEELFIAGMQWAFASHLGGRHITADMWPDLMQWMRSFLKDHDPDMKEDYVNSDGTLDEYFLVSLFGTVLFQDLWELLVVY